MRKLFIIIALLQTVQMFAQINTDSLEKILPFLKGKEKARVLSDLCWELKTINSEKAYKYGKNEIELAQKLKDSSLIAQGYNDVGAVLYLRGDFKLSNQYNIKALEIRRNLKDKAGIASSLSKMGNCYHELGNYKQSLVHLLEAEKIFESLNNYHAMALLQDNIGSVYRSIGLPKESILFHKKAIKANKTIGNIDGVANAYGNLAMSLSELNGGNSDSIFYYYYKARLLFEQNGNKIGLSTVLNNLAIQYKLLNKMDSVLFLYKKAYDLVVEMDDKASISVFAKNLAVNYSEAGEVKLAAKYFDIALKSSKATSGLKFMHETYDSYSRFLFKNGNYEKAFLILDSSIVFHDSVINENTSKVVAELEKKYTSTKKDAEIKLLNKDNLLKEANIEKQKQQKYIVYGGLVIALLLSIFIFNRLQITKKQKIIIEEKSVDLSEAIEELNQTNEEISAQRDQIELQKHKIEHAHNEVKSSIRYAERIQKAMLSTDDSWDRIGEERFILFKPRDVVSGDFYWAYSFSNVIASETKQSVNTNNDIVVWAAADCTGHGVPGAFMSMLGIGLLNEIVAEGGITDPGNILNILRSKIIKSLEQKGDDQRKDGMDIALCVWNKKTNVLHYAGANNPLLIIRGEEMIEQKADKMPIGKYVNDEKPFTTHEIQLQNGDTVYTFTDGFQDQFGGAEGKKYMVKRMKNYLLELNGTPMAEQKELLNQEFVQWMKTGNTEQIDDVCIIGVRI